jgi:UBX domain-containing protein 1
MDTEQQDMVAQFCGVTGANASSAQTALTSANWNLQEAVALYFAAQEGGSDNDEDDEPVAAPTQSAPQPSSSTTSGRRTGAPAAGGGVRTLRDLQASADDDDDEDEDKKKRDLFAGGEKSGLAVQDPSRGGSGGRGTDHFQNILSQARNNAPRAPGGDDDDEEEPAGPSRTSNFSGRAQTLGGDDAPSRVVADPAAPPAGGRRPGAAALPRISRTMHLWADGVSIDDGPLFRFDDPANQPLMEQINQGHAPLSMLDVQPGQEVDLNLDPHKDENYVKPKPKYKPFGGSGQRLGSPTPGVAAPSSSTAAAPAPAQQVAAPAAAAGPVNEIDESVPTITLQIRLGDGSRVQSRFNTTQTIGDVYNFVSRTSAASGDRQWALMTTFPSKELEDKSVVLGDMSDFKRGGVVVQKWK